MVSRLVIIAGALLGAAAGAAVAQTTEPRPPSTGAISAGAPNVPAAQRPRPTGTCTILRGEAVADEQACAVSDAAPRAGIPDAPRDLVYIWPSGNKTVVGGGDDDFSVNGNAAVPMPDTGRGLCLKVERTGNTFCYKPGVRQRLAAQPSQAGAPPPAARPPEVKRPPPAAPASPAAAASSTSSGAAETLAEEKRLRVAAEEKVKALETEVARLTEEKNRGLAEIAEKAKADEAEELKRAEAVAKTREAGEQRIAATLKEIDALQKRCATRDALACERALALTEEAMVTGAIDGSRRSDLVRLQELAQAPFGIPVLAAARAVPVSTWIAGTLAAVLGISLLVALRRRAAEADPLLEAVRATPSLEPSLPVMPPPIPPPIPPMATIPSPPLFPPKDPQPIAAPGM